MTTNAHHLPKNHPVRLILDAAANGQQPTNADLERVKAWDARLPAGQSLTRATLGLSAAVRRVTDAGREGDHAAARRQAEAEWSRLAADMSPEARALEGDANPEPLSDITARMFSH